MNFIFLIHSQQLVKIIKKIIEKKPHLHLLHNPTFESGISLNSNDLEFLFSLSPLSSNNCTMDSNDISLVLFIGIDSLFKAPSILPPMVLDSVSKAFWSLLSIIVCSLLVILVVSKQLSSPHISRQPGHMIAPKWRKSPSFSETLMFCPALSQTSSSRRLPLPTIMFTFPFLHT